jgi:hypothetical protein
LSLKSTCRIRREVFSWFRLLTIWSRAISIGWELRQLGVCIRTVGGTIVCLGVGVAVGGWTNSVDLAISVTSGRSGFCFLTGKIVVESQIKSTRILHIAC